MTTLCSWPLDVSAKEPGEARIIRQDVEILIVACLTPVLRTKLDRCLQVPKRPVGITVEAVGGSQGIMNIFLVGNHLVGLVKILERLIEVAAVKGCHPARVVPFRGLWSDFRVLLAFAKTQVDPRPVRDLPHRTRGDLCKKRGSLRVIPFLKIPDRGFEILQRRFAFRVYRFSKGLGGCFFTGLGFYRKRSARCRLAASSPA